MLEGALSALRENGVPDGSIDVAYVPGSFEIGPATQAMAQTERYAAVICIGAVIRGETAHFDYVSMAVTQAVTRVSLDTGVPCLFGVLTTDTMEQALARSGGPGSNRGYDAAVGALENGGAPAGNQGKLRQTSSHPEIVEGLSLSKP